MQKKPHILFVLDYFWPHVGGLEYLFTHLATGLVEKGYSVSVVTSRFDTDLPEQENYDGVDVYRFSWGRYFFGWWAMWKMHQKLHDVDIAHTSTIMSAPYGWLWSVLTRKPSVLTVHEVFWSTAMKFFWPFGILLWLQEKILFWLRFDRLVSVSTSTASGIPSKKCPIVIYNGIEDVYYNKQKDPDNKPARTFLYFGRTWKTKGFHWFCKHVSVWLDSHPDAQLECLVSDWDVDKTHHHKQIIFSGHVPAEDLIQRIQEVDVVVVPSFSEWFGYSATKACALGTPVVCSDAGALPEVISWKGLLFNSRNSASLLAALDRAYLGDFDQYPKKKFSLETMISSYDLVYQDLL